MPFSLNKRSCQRDTQVQEMTEAIYTFIVDYSDKYGYAPTLREIAYGCYLSASMVSRYLDRLEMQGRLTREPGIARSICVVKMSDKTTNK